MEEEGEEKPLGDYQESAAGQADCLSIYLEPSTYTFEFGLSFKKNILL